MQEKEKELDRNAKAVSQATNAADTAGDIELLFDPNSTGGKALKRASGPVGKIADFVGLTSNAQGRMVEGASPLAANVGAVAQLSSEVAVTSVSAAVVTGLAIETGPVALVAGASAGAFAGAIDARLGLSAGVGNAAQSAVTFVEELPQTVDTTKKFLQRKIVEMVTFGIF